RSRLARPAARTARRSTTSSSASRRRSTKRRYTRDPRRSYFKRVHSPRPMPSRLHTALTSPALRRRLLMLGLVVAAVWIAFFDSHSLLRRVQYYYEYRTLAAENEQL